MAQNTEVRDRAALRPDLLMRLRVVPIASHGTRPATGRTRGSAPSRTALGAPAPRSSASGAPPGLSLLAKKVQEAFHVLAQRAQGLFPVQLAERELDLLLLVQATVQDPPPRARDREALVVEELLDLEKDLHVPLAVHPGPASPLLRAEHLELGLPVPEDVRFHADQVAHLADGVVEPTCRKRLQWITSWIGFLFPASNPVSKAHASRSWRSSLRRGSSGPAPRSEARRRGGGQGSRPPPRCPRLPRPSARTRALPSTSPRGRSPRRAGGFGCAGSWRWRSGRPSRRDPRRFPASRPGPHPASISRRDLAS